MILLAEIFEDEGLRAGLGTHVDLDLLDESGASNISPSISSQTAPPTTPAASSAKARLCAKPIRGHVAGDLMAARVGDACQVQLLAVRPGTPVSVAQIAAEKQAILDKAIRESDRTTAAIFASSFSGKWGDYDPDGIANWD